MNRIIDINSTARLALGIPSAVVPGTPIDTVIPHDYSLIQDYLQTHELTDTELSLPFENNPDARTYHLKTVPMLNPLGAPTGHIVYLQDLSQQKALQDALLSSEGKYRTLVERSTDGIVILQNNSIRYLNRQLASMLGYTVDELTNQHLLDHFSPECQAEVHERELKRLLGEVVGQRYQSVMLHRNGRRIDVELSAGLMEHEGQPAVLFFIRDITEQNFVKAELESSVSLMRSTIESTADGILVVGNDNRIVTYNQRFEEIWQLPHGWQHFFDPDDQLDYLASQAEDPGKFTKQVYEMLAQPDKTGYDQVVLKGGRVLERYATPYRIGQDQQDSRIVGKVWNFRDVTERLKTEETLRIVNDQLVKTIQELEIHNREVTLLGEMGDLLHSCDTVEEAYRVIGEFTRRLFPDENGALFSINLSRTEANAVITFGDHGKLTLDFSPDQCWALRRGRIHSVSADHLELRCQHVIDIVDPEHGYICIPMIAQSETIGLFHVSGIANQQRVEQLAVTVAENIAMSLANIRLRETLRLQSTRDPLTGLHNRRYMDEALQLELRRADRSQRKLGIIMIDLDHFKRFNDSYGHKAGDNLLEEFGGYLLNNSRPEDIICRYGGEEFLLILPGADKLICKEKGEQICHDTQHNLYQPTGFTVSIGIAIFPDNGKDIDLVLNLADKALYEAKNNGRNQVATA